MDKLSGETLIVIFIIAIHYIIYDHLITATIAL